MKAYPHSKHFSDQHSNDFMNGMDLRDYFAAKAMEGMQANGDSCNISLMAEYAYKMADAMMEARKND